MTGGSGRATLSLRLRAAKGGAQLAAARAALSTQGFGTGPGSFAVLVDQARGLAAGQSETLDLFDGSLLDVFGEPAAFRVVREYAVWVESGGDAAGLTVGQAGVNPHPLFWVGTSPGQVVYPGGLPACGTRPAGAVVSATARALKITNNGLVALTYRLYLAGGHGPSGTAMGPLGLTYP